MAGLCEGGNEPPGSLKASKHGHSTTTALLKVTEDIRKAMDMGEVTALTLLDFSNAFGSVDIDLLLAKMKTLHLSDNTLSWMDSYLRDRQQCVSLDNQFSQWRCTKAGVPQGSVLGPLLFSIYINDISKNLQYCRYHLYADDLQLYIHSRPNTINESIDKLNCDLATVSTWAANFGLALNSSKTQAIIIGHKRLVNSLNNSNLSVIQERKAQLLGNGNKMQGYSGSEDEVIGKKKRKAFLDLLLEASLGGVKLTDTELREEVDTFMFEGHDTTSAGMCWALYMLGLHPEVQAKAFEEQERVFQGSTRSVTMKDLSEMKYLEQVIKESLRLYPSVPFIGRLLNEDIEIGGYKLPAGCILTLHIYQVHRNPKQFPNPHKFDPDNFLPERIAKRHPYAYVPFSAGPRNCVGQKFALLEEKTVLSYMLRNFKWSSLDKVEDIKLVAELVLRPENGIRLKITKRGDKRL
ncbi:hypothetical protein ANN_15655 [Periplaneta americana]|uniref:Reverse transcriptase domain-containing protein n=1 Tax=Periplaneta americana TaxID=6978 RepID=A0ABQ8SHU5_PERAM|nr:hypothetical protein ANN_15655 [Periplaneta americana]